MIDIIKLFFTKVTTYNYSLMFSMIKLYDKTIK